MGSIFDASNWILASPDPDNEPDWQPDPNNEPDWQYGIDREVPNSTVASFEEAANRVNQHARIPIHGGAAMIHDFVGLSFAAPVNRANPPLTGAYRDRDLQQIMERSFLDHERARREPTSGLSEEAIDRHLKTKDHHHDSRVSDDICVVCQDSLSREKIATLACGHDFHSGCIKPWLMRNNSCPLCKATGIPLR